MTLGSLLRFSPRSPRWAGELPSKLVLVTVDRSQRVILRPHSGGCWQARAWSRGPLHRLPQCPHNTAAVAQERAESTKAKASGFL